MADVPTEALIFRLFNRLSIAGVAPEDKPKIRLNKTVLTLTVCINAFFAVFWGSAYVALGLPISGSIPLGYALVSFVSLFLFFKNKNFAIFRFSQLLLILILPFLLQWSLGGFARGSAVMIWALMSPLLALYLGDLKHASGWIAAFLALTMLSGLIDNNLAAHISVTIPSWITTLFFVLNMAFASATILLISAYFYSEARKASPLDADQINTFTNPTTGDKYSQPLFKELTADVIEQEHDKPIISTLLFEEPDLIDLIEQFVDCLPAKMDDIETALRNNNMSGFRDYVHSLKGVSGNFGYRDIFDLTRSIELDILDNNLSNITDKLTQLKKVVLRIQQGIRTTTLFEQTSANELKKAAGN